MPLREDRIMLRLCSWSRKSVAWRTIPYILFLGYVAGCADGSVNGSGGAGGSGGSGGSGGTGGSGGVGGSGGSGGSGGTGGSGGWPGPSNTGVPAGVVPTAYTGPCTITVANTVIDA